MLQASHLWPIGEQVCRPPPYGFKLCEVGPAAPVYGLLASQTGGRVRAAAKEAGLGEGLTRHSGRVGMAQDLAASGVELPVLVTVGRWKSFKMPARYTERQAVGRIAENYEGRNIPHIGQPPAQCAQFLEQDLIVFYRRCTGTGQVGSVPPRVACVGGPGSRQGHALAPL